MSKAWCCDHCGVTVSTTRLAPGRGIAGPDGWNSVRITVLGRNTNKTTQSYDLCPDCGTEVRAFLTKNRTNEND